jgi:iron complex transport system substrate-binding protein
MPPRIATSIVSLLPSATEICFALGLGDEVVGVSHECDHPREARQRPIVTSSAIDSSATSSEIDQQVNQRVTDGLSLYQVDLEKLRALRPGVILTQDTCRICAVSLDDVKASLARLFADNGEPTPKTAHQAAHDGPTAAEIISLAPRSLDDVFADILRVGAACDHLPQAHALVATLQARLDRLRATTANLPRPRVLVLEWLAPFMVGGHWTPELIRIAGGDPILAHDKAPTRARPLREIADADADVVLVAPCGFKVEQTLAEITALGDDDSVGARLRSLRAVRNGRGYIIDGNAYFNRPGPRLVDSATLAAAAIHPAQFPDTAHAHPHALIPIPTA